VALTVGEQRDYVDLVVAKEQDIHVIHSGVNVGEFAAEAFDAAAKMHALGLDPRKRLVGFVGWLLPINGWGKGHYEIRGRREKVKPRYCVERNPPGPFSKEGETLGFPNSNTSVLLIDHFSVFRAFRS